MNNNTQFFSAALIKPVVITLLLIACVFFSYSNWFSSLAENYTEKGIERTLVTYAVSRSLNGVISVAQGTEVAVSPAGVGLTFTPGQILDPINDLIERFSWVVLASGTSLGIQRLFLEMTSSSLINGLLTVSSILLVVFIWWLKPEQKIITTLRSYTGRLVIVLILLRFTVPAIAIVNEGLYISFLKPQYEEAQLQLETASEEIRMINQQTINGDKKAKTDETFMDKAEAWLDRTSQSFNIDQQMQSLKQAAADISKQVINMIVVFVVQTIIFPLVFLWVLIRSAKFTISRLVI